MTKPFFKLGERGFTLIETLVAVSLIMIAISGPLYSASQAHITALDAKNRLAASYLAQEGIEYIRMLRDTTYLADLSAGKADLSNTAFYTDFLYEDAGSIPTSIRACRDPDGDGTADGAGVCALDPALSVGIGGIESDRALQLCDTGGNVNACPVLYRSSGGLYNLTSTGSPSIFRRSIQFYDLGRDVEVVVTVSWNSRGVKFTGSTPTNDSWSFYNTTRSVVLTSYLAPWE